MREPPVAQILISLILRGEELEPDEVSGRLGVTPTVSYRAGNPFPNGRGMRQRSGWRLKVAADEAVEIDALLDQLRALVTIEAADFAAGCDDLGLRRVVLVTLRPRSFATPSVVFSAEFISWAAELGASIDVDIDLIELSPTVDDDE